MYNHKADILLHSPLSEFINNFIQEKRACGYQYKREYQEFVRLDRFLCEVGLQSPALPRKIVDHWTAKQAHEKPSNQKLRKIRIRQLSLYLRRQGLDAYVPEATKTTSVRTEFTPYIFSRKQIRNILETVDATPPDSRSPRRHLVMPEVFRLLYYCGMRISEVLQLKLSDVDLTAGVITVRESKFNKDRLVPLAHSMAVRLRRYVSILDKTGPSSILFPSPSGKPYSKITVYQFFRQLLWKCNIPHGGRGRGPRLHDIRHTFAVHKLESWYRQGADLGVKLPLLATYMGHKNLVSTQWYLHLTPEIFPSLVNKTEQFAGHIIPRRAQ
jgi:integrase/recombinase XerD